MAKHLGKLLAKKAANAAGPSLKIPARTRFAPSPTGLMHLGSMRTAVYNYLWAKATGGQFLLRLEDTDQKRLFPGAEANIYKSLEWAGLKWDEGPVVEGPYAPYRQSDRTPIYKKHIKTLIDNKHAYRCFCSKDRLNSLTESARALHPPSTVSYDRKCAHLTPEESEKRAQSEEYIVRFRSPDTYPEFNDVLHGPLTINPQVNQADVRFDDFTLVKSDGLPTYHFANVVDDNHMKITHVIRGEEWLPSTPKHIALYEALGWTPPQFVHIPLLTSAGGKKLSKRKSDQGVLEYADEVLPEAFVNFVALLGWSPARQSIGKKVSEVMDLKTLESSFSLDALTKGNVQVDMSKLWYFDQTHFKKRLSNGDIEYLAEVCHRAFKNKGPKDIELTLDDTVKILTTLKGHVSSVRDFIDKAITLNSVPVLEKRELDAEEKAILESVVTGLEGSGSLELEEAKGLLDQGHDKKKVFQLLRYALLGSVPGISIVEALVLLGRKESSERLNAVLNA